MHRGDMTNEQWNKLEPLLPKRANRGRPRGDDRSVINGIVWVLRTGAPWRDVPERYGKWPTIYSRFQRWRKAGVWERILGQLQADSDQAGQLDWELHLVDGTVIRAHQHAAGAKKAVPTPKRSVAARAD
jgi:transposase